MSWTVDGVGLADLGADALAIGADVSVRAAVVIGVAGVCATLLRQAPARLRHAIWAAAFAAVAALPILAVLDVGPASLARSGGGLALGLAAAWAAGFLLLTLRQTASLISLRRLAAAAASGPAIPGADVRIGGELGSPVTFGWRAVVLLPRSFEQWPAEQREQVLLHEGAHVARRDWAVQRAVSFVCAVFWFNPLLWLARRFLILEAERAADEAVLRSGVRPSSYAQLLLERATELTPFPALAARHLLEIRVRSLLGGPREGGSWALLAMVALLAMPPFLSGLTVVPPPPAPHCGPDLTEALLPLDGLTANAAQSNRVLADRLFMRSEAGDLYAAASRLVRNCPYNRASAGLPELLGLVLTPHFGLLADPRLASSSPSLARGLGDLRAALDQHGRLIEALGLAPMPTPEPGDYLPAQSVWGSAVLPFTRGQSPALIERAIAELDTVRDLVDAYPAETKELIDEANSVLKQATEDRWSMKGELLAYRTTLMEIDALAGAFAHRVPEELRDPLTALHADTSALLVLLDRYLGLYC